MQNQENFHWVQLSSCGAYGKPALHPSMPRYMDENSHDNPSGEYEHTKTEADRLVIAFSNNTIGLNIRLFGPLMFLVLVCEVLRY